MKVSVVYAGDMARSWINLDVAEDSTLNDAIQRCGILDRHPEIDLSKAKVGIYGKFSSLTNTLSEGDRIEIYRPITRVLDEDDDDDDDD